MARLVRDGIPAAILLAGIGLVVAVGGGALSGLGVVLIGVAALVVLANVLARLSISSERGRDQEQAARRTFTRTGRWPRDSGTAQGR